MRSTLCRLLLVPAIAAGALLVSQSARAETVTVPFSFNANGESFPAGAYTVEEGMNATLVTLHLKSGGETISLAIGPGDPGPTDERVVLHFRMSGDQHMLDSIEYRGKTTAHLGGSRNKPSYADREKTPRPASGQ